MNTNETRVETADAGPGRLTSAAKSLARYYRREMTTLQGSQRIAREEIAAGRGDVEETRRSLEELERQERALKQGWENSSLRRHIAERQHATAGGIERRVALATPGGVHLAAGIRATDTTATTTAKRLTGHAAVFNKWADIGWFREQIAPGAFANALKTSDVRYLFNHDSNFIYGRTSAATLELREDRTGLAFVCHLLAFDPASYALARRIDRRDISGCSFSFTVVKDQWKLATSKGEMDERTILEIGQLYDVGPVTYPAYPQTDVQAVFEDVARAASMNSRGSSPARTRATISPARQQYQIQRLDLATSRLKARLQETPADRDRRIRLAEFEAKIGSS